jgi:hypothetical protein
MSSSNTPRIRSSINTGLSRQSSRSNLNNGCDGDLLPLPASKYSKRSSSSSSLKSRRFVCCNSKTSPKLYVVVMVLASFAFGVYMAGVIYVAFDLSPAIWGNSASSKVASDETSTSSSAATSASSTHNGVTDRAIKDINQRWEAKYGGMSAWP